ncbi:hypothetical protein HU200_017008 [Digitaria exilis]|uniref:Uncharacterized protein n=1 Tax=Digitaria exilis TaxID=1010633 RepID=A0A835KI87_9POAL|nr:hypothetical protein HU200_017008 [Digitaria exilis]
MLNSVCNNVGRPFLAHVLSLFGRLFVYAVIHMNFHIGVKLSIGATC